MTGQSLNATPGKIRVASLAVAILAAAMLALAVTGDALAQSSLGIGTNDAMPVSTGLFARQLAWINLKQQEFYRALAGAMKAMRQDDSKLWVLLGLSFLYGVFHAAGPGHGKAVISAYMVANECALRRGILLSFVSALLQAFTAIALMLVAFLVLRGAAISMTDAAWFLEIASYVFITGFGAWLLWKKASPALLAAFCRPPVYSLSTAGGDALHSASPQGGRTMRRARLNHPDASPTPLCSHDRAAGTVCESCGHSHAVDPSTISGERLDRSAAWAAVTAVGIRPCSGALIVLSFAFLNGPWLGGDRSVLAMALGTAITVAILAARAVRAKDWAVAPAGGGRWGDRIHGAVEFGGAALVFLFGLLLLSASLAAV